MIKETLVALYKRDLEKLREEITLYKEEANLWKTDKQISNSGGNLCLHLVGNLNTFIGNTLADDGYTRNRELEFSAKNVPREELLTKIDETIAVVLKGLNTLTPEGGEKEFPVKIWEQPASMEYTLVFLAAHLSYHLGQINYHRRLLDA